MKVEVRGRGTVFGLWAVVALLVGASGCQQTTPPGADMASARIGNSSYTFLHWKEGLRVMMWFDLAEAVSGEGSGSTSDPVYEAAGFASASDGRRVDWRLETVDGKTAIFSIDGEPYDLSQGPLFLVRTKGGDVRVGQLERDLTALRPTNESCEAFAKVDPDVTRFIHEARGVP